MSSVETPALRVVASPPPGPPVRRAAPARVLAAVLAVALTASVYADALYEFRLWGIATIVALAGLGAIAITGRLAVPRAAAVALAGLLLLLALSAASMAWADSVERAWLETHRVLLYTALFTVGVAVFRDRSSVRVFLAALAATGGVVAAAQVAALVLGAQDAFLEHRLNAPVGYINGTAGFFLICVWPALAIAERPVRPLVAGLAMAAMTAQGSLLVLTQSRSVVPAFAVAAVALVAVAPGRTARLWALLVVAAAVAAALPWTLDVYAQGVPGTAPRPALIEHAGLAIAVMAAFAGLYGLPWRERVSIPARRGCSRHLPSRARSRSW